MMHLVRTLLGAAALLAAGWPARVLADEGANFVIAADGRWTLAGSTARLQIGQGIPAGARLSVDRPTTFDSIAIVDGRTGAFVLRVRCSPVENCSQPLTVPAGSDTGRKDTGLLQAIVEKALKNFRGAPPRYVSHVSRGALRVADGVLPLADGKVDLAPLLASLPPATFAVRWLPATCTETDACKDALGPYRYEWTPPRPVALAVPLLKPGTYRLLVAQAVDPSRESQAWVKLTAPAEHGRVAALYAEVGKRVNEWGDDVDPGVKRGVLRAALEGIAD